VDHPWRWFIWNLCITMHENSCVSALTRHLSLSHPSLARASTHTTLCVIYILCAYIICIYTYIYSHTCVHALCVCTYIDIHHRHTYLYMYTHAPAYAYKCVCKHAYVCHFFWDKLDYKFCIAFLEAQCVHVLDFVGTSTCQSSWLQMR